MALYGAMFSQYGINTAQVLVTKSDFQNEYTRQNLQSTLNELLALNIVPILNTNDAVAAPPQKSADIKDVISIKDNDSLAARLAVLVNSDLLLIMSDVNGLYNRPPTDDEARLLHTYCPDLDNNFVNFGGVSSKVGTGGMQAKVQAASWALDQKISVVICNGARENAITDIVKGKKIGTFFTTKALDAVHGNSSSGANVESVAAKGNLFSQQFEFNFNWNFQARDCGRILQCLTNEERSQIIRKYAGLLVDRSSLILEANKVDLEEAKISSMSILRGIKEFLDFIFILKILVQHYSVVLH